MHELHYLLEKLKVCDVMTTNVITVTPETPIDEAARLMLQHRIGSVPVLRGKDLVGIITETDMLQAFVDVMGIHAERTRLELVLEDRAGVFVDICRIIQNQGGDIASVVTATATHRGEQKKVMVFRLEGVSSDVLVRELEAGGHTVLSATA